MGSDYANATREAIPPHGLQGLRPEAEVLRWVAVRLIRDDERAWYDHLREEHHFLYSDLVVVPSLRYVAELGGQWLTLLTFSTAALYVKGRERWIGRTPRQGARSVGFVVKTNHFLLLTGTLALSELGLTSRTVGLWLRCLSKDWQKRRGQLALAA